MRELKPHQLKALDELKNGKVLKGGVGTGKSFTAIAYFFTRISGGSLERDGNTNFYNLKTPRDLYIITTAKKRDELDWEGECAPFGLSKERELSAGKIQVTVDSWNNVSNYKDVKNAFFIFDEQRLVGRGPWVQSFLKIAEHNKWIVLSATPGDTWLDYVPLFIANGFYSTRTEFLRRHVVYNHYSKFPKVDHYVETGRLEALRRRITVDMPYDRHTVRHVVSVPVEYNLEKFNLVTKKRWHIYEDRPLKDVGEMFIVMRKVCNEDLSRLAAVMEISEKHDRLIIFYNFNYELDTLRTLADTLGIPVAEYNGHKHDPVPETEKWLYLVQYTAGAEGWNCVSTNAMVLYSLNYSWKVREQSMGRIDRLNTEHANLYYYQLQSTAPIDLAILKSIRAKETFNESKWGISWPKTQK